MKLSIDVRDIFETGRRIWGESAGAVVIPKKQADKVLAELTRLYGVESGVADVIDSGEIGENARVMLMKVLGE